MRFLQSLVSSGTTLLTYDEKKDFYRWLAPKNRGRFQILNLLLIVCVCMSCRVHPDVFHFHGSVLAGGLLSLGILIAGDRFSKKWIVDCGKCLSVAASVGWTMICVNQTMERGGFGLPHYLIGVMVLSIVVYMGFSLSVRVYALTWVLYILLLIFSLDNIPFYVFVYSFIFSSTAVFISRTLVQEKMFHFKSRGHINALHKKNHTLTHLSMMDELTSLPNRRYFDKLFKKIWQDESLSDCNIVLILGDIDFFKSFNDTHGHVAGDSCLAHVARTLESCIRKEAPVMRIGGEEFAIMLENISVDEGYNVACRLIESLKKECRVTMSFGVACMSPVQGSALTLYKNADRALYRAKANGRSCVEVF